MLLSYNQFMFSIQTRSDTFKTILELSNRELNPQFGSPWSLNVGLNHSPVHQKSSLNRSPGPNLSITSRQEPCPTHTNLNLCSNLDEQLYWNIVIENMKFISWRLIGGILYEAIHHTLHETILLWRGVSWQSDIQSTWPLDGFWGKVGMNVRDAQNVKLDLPDVWTHFLPLEGLSDAGLAPMLCCLSGLEGMFDGGCNTINSWRTALNMCRLDCWMWWWKKAKCTSTMAPHNLLSYWVSGMSWWSVSYAGRGFTMCVCARSARWPLQQSATD